MTAEFSNRLLDDEFVTRMKLFAEGSGLSEKFRAFNDGPIMRKYPSLNRRQCVALHYILQCLWDLEFSDVCYVEVVYRLHHFEKMLFPSNKTIRQTIAELRKYGILNIKMGIYKTGQSLAERERDGYRPPIVSKYKVLRLPEELRIEALDGMREIYKGTMDAFFLPRAR